jgi:hypothetical protein
MSMIHRVCLVGVALCALASCGDSESGQTSAGGATGEGGTTGGAGAGEGGSGAMGGGGGTGGDPCVGRPRGTTSYVVDGMPHCYWLVTTGTPQIDANDACGLDASLVTIQSSGENDHVAAFTAETFPLWLGLRCDANPGAACTADPSNYVWMNGETLGYDNWAANEPSEPRGAAMHDDGSWYGYDSLNNVFAYVCEGGPVTP